MKDKERRNIMEFTFKVEFNQNGELLSVKPKDEATVEFKKFKPEYEPLKEHVKERGPETVVLLQTIPIDLKLLILKGDDPCITHKGRRY
jgi:hypothetical protein